VPLLTNYSLEIGLNIEPPFEIVRVCNVQVVAIDRQSLFQISIAARDKTEIDSLLQ
jgi:hypothetical protein